MSASDGQSLPLLPYSFFEQDTLTCARALIGQWFVVGNCSGRIVETEAYLAEGDEACHAFTRASTRDFLNQYSAGTAYVYVCYGVYWMMNVLIKNPKDPKKNGLVLLRAIEPVYGIKSMAQRRNQPIKALKNLCSGPGKLAMAFGITGDYHGKSVCENKRFGFLQSEENPYQIITDRRIGLTRAIDLPWRFLAENNAFVSVPVKKS